MLDKAGEDLRLKYENKLVVNPDLDRSIVSFQESKKAKNSRWFKYKEGYSPSLMRYVFDKAGITDGVVLDPFAGSGTTLFSAADAGLSSVGVELLPVGCEIIAARAAIRSDPAAAIALIDVLLESEPWANHARTWRFPHLPITEGAFPDATEESLERYMSAVNEMPARHRTVLWFAAMCVLEEISFTRKDGQYLRWDRRSARKRVSKTFDKGVIAPFPDAIKAKLHQIRDDAAGTTPSDGDDITVHRGSCLELLPTIAGASVSAVVTSPPYCNRYDYTRTYALELALLGVDDGGVKALRQAMLSCTVENRDKDLEALVGPEKMGRCNAAFDGQEFLAAFLGRLNDRRAVLNNPGIPRMVKNYFLEMTLTMMECARVLKPGAPLVVVNDNVRYDGVDLPVDLVLADLASQVGLTVDVIWQLPRGKGNSSQQMGEHGRNELRKCVYVFRADR